MNDGIGACVYVYINAWMNGQWN